MKAVRLADSRAENWVELKVVRKVELRAARSVGMMADQTVDK